ncbi:XVIPCD domain-containing protein [Variovorax sp. Sphag1AA]|uniref:XVIPCD domain-containing protein n=1 Tax=Variovorax sp. Sphag1AA TaxID=2587027 RepID=UPI00161CE792|nr:XVIPCD domain-containing protein [Variovorax sp. Sphag1AA]MBB3178456.1 hypothetical protein [Variovorax sp. Sphag1AA]
MSKESETIDHLIVAEETRRIYRMADDSTETRDGGTVAWRNNNPGNLKFEYATSADATVQSKRTKDEALKAAQSNYDGVVALDQWGNAVFATEEAGRAAQAALLTRIHGSRTIEQTPPLYAVSDYSGKSNVQAYVKSIYTVGDAQGVDLRKKKIGEMSATEISALQDGMRKVEGFKVGEVAISPPSFRWHEEKSLQRMHAQGLGPHTPAASSIAEAGHSGNALYRQALIGLEKYDIEHSIKLPPEQARNVAAALAVEAQKSGFKQIDHVAAGTDGRNIFAVHGTPGTARSKVIGVETVPAMAMSIAESSKAFDQAHRAQQATQRIAPPEVQPAQSNPVQQPGMAR